MEHGSRGSREGPGGLCARSVLTWRTSRATLAPMQTQTPEARARKRARYLTGLPRSERPPLDARGYSAFERTMLS